MAKTPSKQSAKTPKKATTGKAKSKKRTETYSSYIYKGELTMAGYYHDVLLLPHSLVYYD